MTNANFFYQIYHSETDMNREPYIYDIKVIGPLLEWQGIFLWNLRLAILLLFLWKCWRFEQHVII